MYVVVIAWLYVVLMAAVAEAASITGTVLGAIVTFLLYGLLPLGIVVYIMGTPGRKRALKARAMAEHTTATGLKETVTGVCNDLASETGITSIAPDADGKPPTGSERHSVAPVRKKP